MSDQRPPVPKVSEEEIRARLSRYSVGSELVEECVALHLRASARWGSTPIDAAAPLLDLVASGRTRFVRGNSSSRLWSSDHLEAIAHAAQHGFRLCGAELPDDRNAVCWLPAGHDGGCELRGWWRWLMLYGNGRYGKRVCPQCTPHQHLPVPADCVHDPRHAGVGVA